MYSEDIILDNFNFNSSAQLLTLFKRAGIKLEKTNEPSLVEYIKNNKRTEAFEIIDILLEYRETEKLISTYGESFAANKNSITKKMHPKYMQAFTVTGRLSSNDFNIQNIPKELRPCFIPDNDNYCFVTCDLSGQELRIAASHSQDKAILRNFTGGDDLHSLIAQASYRIIHEDPNFEVSKKVNGDLRNHHKATTFAWIYRAGFRRVMMTLNTTEEKAKRIVKSMESIMPKLSNYLQTQMTLIYSESVIRDNSFTNRLKWISDEKCPAKEDYKKAKEAANFPIQATGASMMKLAMVLVHKHIKENNLDWRIILTVHDELVVQIPKEGCEESANKVKLLMEKAGNYFLHNVVMESEKVIASYWNK
jgi:DNA polymerase I-like protein with 3'-5' exonuclease and polymerase domains